MNKKIEIGFLALLAIIDAYLIGHPNLLGKFGLFFYKYSMINSFPKALVTVGISVGVSYLLANFLASQKGKNWAKWALIIFLVLAITIFITVFFKFSAGTYAHTGKSFIYGMYLLPLLLIYVFGSRLLWFGEG